MATTRVKIRLSEREIQDKFNREYLPKILQGEYQEKVEREGEHPINPRYEEVFCTRSQTVIYRDNENRDVVRVHRILRPNGTLGGSGKPDPKVIYEGSTLYWTPHKN